MPKTEKVEIDNVFCDGETAKAIHVLQDDGTEFWVPKSVVHDDSEVYAKDHEGTLVLPEWWAIKEGLV